MFDGKYCNVCLFCILIYLELKLYHNYNRNLQYDYPENTSTARWSQIKYFRQKVQKIYSRICKTFTYFLNGNTSGNQENILTKIWWQHW